MLINRTITNRADQILAARQVILPEDVRSLTLDNVLVDTGATTLCLPAAAIRTIAHSTMVIQYREPSQCLPNKWAKS